MSYFESDDYLQLSGLQHFSFCRRQWALIHIEQQWSENLLTTEGHILHNRVHDIHSIDIRDGILTMRNLPIKSERMKITGCCDAVEFIPCENGVTLNDRNGTWRLRPVEYKHGREKINDCDRLQVTAQAMCLEEMFCCDISEAAIFYHETHQKEIFSLSSAFRTQVEKSLLEMYELYLRGYTPVVKKHSGCKSCSLAEQCLPLLQKGKGYSSVNDYLQQLLSKEEES